MKSPLVIALTAVVFFAPLAQATEIRQFDRMSGDDQIRFIDKLVDSVEDASKSDPALLARVKRFFLAKQPGENISGMGRFELNLSLARIADLQAAAKNPKAHRLEVEDVMYVTLERSGIVLGKTFRPSASNFKPEKPLLQKTLTKEDANRALAQTQAWIARTVQPEHTFSHGGPESGLSGFSTNEKAVAFYLGLAALAALADGSSNSGPGSSGGIPIVDTRPWWQQMGYPTFHDAVRANCLANTTAAVPNC
ncbi:MAG: hypothetical protein WAU89_25540 [Candidatus Acidiferrales bacterium]